MDRQSTDRPTEPGRPSSPAPEAAQGGATGSAEPGESVSPPDSFGLEPTEAELDAWAQHERERRQAWLSGPTPEERAAFARRERERRLAELTGGDASLAERDRMILRYGREAQLAAEGAVSLLLKFSRRGFAELIRAGREWEEDFVGPPRRRRIPIDDERA